MCYNNNISNTGKGAIMFNTDEKMQRVLLVACNTGEYDVEASLGELAELTATAGGEVIANMVQNLQSTNNATYIGPGKLQEVKQFCNDNEVDLVIFDDSLSGSQIKNIEEIVEVRIIDRTMLILDIFAMHARTAEGKLQVELAQQRYLLPRLYGMGKQLSRQGGGASGSIGNRGPGETKLESDRRHIQRRIENLEAELAEMEQRRDLTRKRRLKNGVVTIAIVGYTNVGKSTLLNLLTGAGVLAENKLFATLDPTARELRLKDGQSAILIDTVGLIQRLPHQLVKAFRSTLEEAASADIILNLCDISDERVDVQLKVTNDVLGELGCGDIPIITVYNKIDKVDYDNVGLINTNSVFISAKENRGIDDLFDCIGRVLAEKVITLQLLFPYDKGNVLDKVRNSGLIVSEEYTESGTAVKAIIEKKMQHLVEEFIVQA